MIPNPSTIMIASTFRVPLVHSAFSCRRISFPARCICSPEQLNDGIVTPAGKDITLKEYAQQWLEARRGIIAVRTIRCYDDCLSNYVLPKLGHLKVRQITTAQLLPWLTSLKANGFSVNALRLARATLSACLGHAVLEGLTETNAMMYLSKQKTAQPGKLTKADRDDKIRPFESPEQFDRFLAVALHPS